MAIKDEVAGVRLSAEMRLARAGEHLEGIESLLSDYDDEHNDGELGETPPFGEVYGLLEDIRSGIDAAIGDLSSFQGIANRYAGLHEGNGSNDTDNRIWQGLFTEGRTIFYEGDDPEGFRQQIKAEFGFDVAEVRGRDFDLSMKCGHDNTWNEDHGYSFHCPPEHMDAIYGNSRFPLGS